MRIDAFFSPRQCDERSHESRVASQRGLVLIRVPARVAETIEVIGTSHHGAFQEVWVGRILVAKLPSLGAAEVVVCAGDGGCSVVWLVREFVAVADDVAHVERVLAEDVIDLRESITIGNISGGQELEIRSKP